MRNIDSQSTTILVQADARPIKLLSRDLFFCMNNDKNYRRTKSIDNVNRLHSFEIIVRETTHQQFYREYKYRVPLYYLTNKNDHLIVSDGSKIATKNGGRWLIAKNKIHTSSEDTI